MKEILFAFVFILVAAVSFADDCVDCAGQNQPISLTGRVQKFWQETEKVAEFVQNNCKYPRPPEPRDYEIPFPMMLEKGFDGTICGCIARDNSRLFAANIKRKLEEIEQRTNKCYILQDPEIYDSITCPFNGEYTDTIFANAAKTKCRLMMDHLFMYKGFDIFAKDAEGKNVFDYVQERIAKIKYHRELESKEKPSNRREILLKAYAGEIKEYEEYFAWMVERYTIKVERK
jgi:hypothetical protein